MDDRTLQPDRMEEDRDETRNSAEFRNPGPVPILHRKKRAAFSALKLKPTVDSQHDTLRVALDVAKENANGGKHVHLITRMASHWALFGYEGAVKFKHLEIGNLPLGGDPLEPKTYVLDGKRKFAAITHSQPGGYQLEIVAEPTKEPTLGTPWVDAIVPVLDRNHGRNEMWKPRFTLRPSLEELPSALLWIDQKLPKGTKIKASGSLHSWSKTAVAKDVNIAPWRMQLAQLIDEDEKVYRSSVKERKNLVRVGSGVTVRDFNRWLWLNEKSLPLLGGCDAQTIGGLLPTGTHGSVFTYGPMAELIRSTDLVLAGGGQVRIEPADGITEPELWSSAHPDIELVQNDDHYYAAIINMGTMGVVASYMLEVTDRFHLREVRTLNKLEELREKLKGGKIYDFVGAHGHTAQEMETIPARISNGKDGGFKGHPWSAYHVELYLNPHSDNFGITSRHPIAIANDSALGFTPPGRDLIRSIELGAKFTRPALPVWFEENFTKVVVWGINTLMILFPKLTPWIIDRALATIVDKEYEDRSFNVFNNGNGQNRIPALIGTVFVPLEDDKWIDAIQAIQDVAKNLAKGNHWVTAPASVRFVKATKALLGVPKDCCSFEFTYTGRTKYAQGDIDAFDVALRQKFGKDGVWTHWGQMMRAVPAEDMAARYKDYGRWREIRDRLDPGGVFLNDWQVGILPTI
jgi:hypothetical protein